MRLDETTIRDLIDLTDELGVLSFYAGHTPAQAADPKPTAPIEIRNQLKDLRSRLAPNGDLAKAVEQRLGKAGPAIDRFLDPKAPGRGRALFVGVASGETTTISLQIPFRERVVHHDRPYVRPLVAAYDEGRPAGILVVSRAGARVLRWAVGEVEELATHDFELTDAQLADVKSGPSPGHPQHAHHGFTNRERFEDRIDENHHRFLRGVVDRVASHAKEQGWDRLVLSGPPKVREAAHELLDSAVNGVRILQAEPSWEDSSPHVIAEQIWPLLRSVHRDREVALAETTVERALGGGPAAIGLRHVCGALNEGRVAHLVFDNGLQLEGFRSEEGTLHPRVEGVVAQADLEMVREPLFVERMIAQAVATKAAVTPLEDDAATPLAPYEGVGALLRW